jgi:hypothetical protein
MINFLGIGAQKAGTTWIYNHLQRHPDVEFPAGKEVHFWDLYRDRGLAWWIDLFPNLPRRKRGEITPAYATLERSDISTIAHLCPKVRLFFSIRNPIARAWSSALMALSKAGQNVEETSNNWFLDHVQSAGSLRRGSYINIIQNWTRYFPGEQLHIILFDDIALRPREVLKNLCSHLEIDAAWVDSLAQEDLENRVSAGPARDVPVGLLSQLRDMYAAEIEVVSRVIARDLSYWSEWDGRRSFEAISGDRHLIG